LGNIGDGAFFTLSFSAWAGAQRVADAPQIVFRVNAQSLYTHLAYADPEAMKAVNEALFANCNAWHPADEWSVGWLRLHKDDENELLFVDEVQSDALESLRNSRRSLDQKAVARVERYLRRWHLHGFASVHRWANAIGYRAGIHSRKSAAAKSGMTQSERKWNTYYAPIIRQFGLREEAVSGYPAPIMVEPPVLPSQH
jgi:hypothetical protein